MILNTQAHLDGSVSIATGGTSIMIPFGVVAFQPKVSEKPNIVTLVFEDVIGSRRINLLDLLGHFITMA